ncbi:MAG: carbohydrate ABC transporter permease [Spirochaetaceae bacterium]|jgi:raffinose/stachyose/melibiose transport system permease protein|nr:carbohydrate ABC transporter permease [Spirochaetaceae bacterium]
MKNKLSSNIITVIMTIMAFIYLYPLLLVVINSFKTYQEITESIVSLPKRLVWENYANAFKLMKYPQLFFNTLVATSVGVIGVVFFSSMAGFKLSRTKTRLSWILFIIAIAPMMIPFHSFMIALVKVAKSLGMLGSTVGLGVFYWGLGIPLALFLYHGFVKGVPRGLEECAMIDGASPFQVFFQIIFPLLQPVTVSVIVLNTMWMWNDFLLPLLFLSGAKKAMTLQLAAYNFFGLYKIEWNFAMAGVLLTILPAVIFYLALQKHIVKGMVSGAIKT